MVVLVTMMALRATDGLLEQAAGNGHVQCLYSVQAGEERRGSTEGTLNAVVP